MKAFILAIALIGATTAASAEPLKSADAAAHKGESVTIEGTVTQVFTDPRSGNIFLDFDGRYPANPFAAVIFSGDAKTFTDLQSFEGATIDVTGTIDIFQGRAEMVLKSPNQIQRR